MTLPRCCARSSSSVCTVSLSPFVLEKSLTLKTIQEFSTEAADSSADFVNNNGKFRKSYKWSMPYISRRFCLLSISFVLFTLRACLLFNRLVFSSLCLPSLRLLCFFSCFDVFSPAFFSFLFFLLASFLQSLSLRSPRTPLLFLTI